MRASSMRPANSTGAGSPLEDLLPELKPPWTCCPFHPGALSFRGPNVFAAFAMRPFSFLHIAKIVFKLVSYAFSRSIASRVSLMI